MSDLSEFLSAARAKVEAATPGPWTVRFSEYGGYDCMSSAYVVEPVDARLDCALAPDHVSCKYGEVASIAANASLIVFSRNVLPALLDVAEAAERYERANAAAWRQTGTAGTMEGDDDLAYGFDEAESALRAAIARLCQNKEK